MKSPLQEHKELTYSLAKSLNRNDIYYWLLRYGYYPEAYVMPPCFCVTKTPRSPKKFFMYTKKNYRPTRSEYVKVHFPKTELTDKTFGIMDPEIHNDISYHVTRNWSKIVSLLFHNDSKVVSYSFPIPVNSKAPGRLSYLRAGRMIYEFIGMVDDDIASVTYQFTHLVKADIKNFYPSIYTHSIAWAIHGKRNVRKPANIHNYNLLGNRLDKLFQNANDGCTNGIAIGPVVSDLIGEIILSACDRIFSKLAEKEKISFQATRFKDDYRILVKSANDAQAVIKLLQAALKEYNLELSDNKTRIDLLPDGLFRDWVSKYHLVNPKNRTSYSWKEFRELYLSVLRIDKECPGTGVIDRFLADISNKHGRLKVGFDLSEIQKVLSMLLMLGNLRIKAFPKIIAILEAMIRTPIGKSHKKEILGYLRAYLKGLSKDEEKNKYLISWISYFVVSNGFQKTIRLSKRYKDPITRSIFNNRGAIFKSKKEFRLFTGCKEIAKTTSMAQHLNVFDPPIPE